MRASDKTRRGGTAPRFDPQALRELAGEAAYERGLAYQQAGQVELLSLDPKLARARVLGSEVYRVELREGGGARGGAISGHCTCPAFERGFCKHLVATALAVNAATAGGREVPDRLGAIRAHLRAQGIDRLVGMLMDLAERDPALLDRLELAASAAKGDSKELAARFRAALKRALQTPGGFVAYGEAGGWVQGVLGVLDEVEALIGAGHAALVLELLDDFLPRFARALEKVDDSDGGGGEILDRAAAIHLAACRAAPRPDPLVLARDLFARETTDEYGTFNGASDRYAELLGPAGLAEYRRLAQAVWEKLPQGRRMIGRVMVMTGEGVARHTLFRILDRLAEREGDLDRRIALRAADLVHPSDYLGLAQLCMEHGRETEALRWAEEGAWLFDDPSGERLLLFLAERLAAAGRAAEAEATLWRGFERRPSAELYRALAKAVRGAGEAAQRRRAALADRAVALLAERIGATKGGGMEIVARTALVGLLVEILMGEQRLPAAWEAVRRHGCPDPLRLRLAEASEATLPEEAIAAYTALAERQAALANRQGYTEACGLVARVGALRARRGETAAQRAFVEDLLRCHATKRSFVAMLREMAGAPPPPLTSPSRAAAASHSAAAHQRARGAGR